MEEIFGTMAEMKALADNFVSDALAFCERQRQYNELLNTPIQ